MSPASSSGSDASTSSALACEPSSAEGFVVFFDDELGSPGSFGGVTCPMGSDEHARSAVMQEITQSVRTEERRAAIVPTKAV